MRTNKLTHDEVKNFVDTNLNKLKFDFDFKEEVIEYSEDPEYFFDIFDLVLNRMTKKEKSAFNNFKECSKIYWSFYIVDQIKMNKI